MKIPLMKRKWFKILLILFVAGILFEGTLLVMVIRSESQPPISEPADVIIVPGAKVMPDGVLSNTLEFRVMEAAEAYRSGLGKVIIVCGAQGHDEPIAEAAAMRAYLLENYDDIPPDAVIEEGASYSTVENFRNAKKIMDARGDVTAVVITSNYHIQRSIWLARGAGIDAQGIGSRASLYPYTHWKLRIRETVAWVKYFLLDRWAA